MKMFSQADIDKRGIKIWRDGKLAEISDFRANDKLTATIVTTKPPQVMTEKEVQATLAKSGGAAAPAASSAAAPAAKPAASAPAPSAAPAPSSAASTSGSAPRTLPKTASPLAAVGLTGLVSLLVGFGLTVARRRSSH